MADLAPIGVQDEHAPRGSDASVGSADVLYEPTDADKKTIKLAEKIFERNKRARAQYDQKWLDFYRMFRGKQWKDQRPSYRHSEVINLVFRTLQSTIPIQLDTHPKFEFLPQEPKDQQLAEILNMVAESDWTKNNWGESLLETVWDSNIYGTGMSSMLAKDSLGRMKLIYSSADPFYCFPDPEAKDVNKDATVMGYSEQSPSFVYAEPMDVRKIKKKYPNVADYIKPDIQDLNRGSKTDVQDVRFRSPIDQKVIVEGSSTLDLINKEKALLVTVFLSPEYCEEDFDEIKQDSVDPETGTPGVPEFVQKARYPNGRKITVCNGVLCEDVDNGYDDGQFPFDRYPNYTLPREFWGISEVEQLEGPQKTFNKLVSFVLDVMTLMGNPVWIVPTASGVDPENLVNKPGLNIETDGNREDHPYRLEGVQLQPYVLQIIDKMASWFDTIGGSQDITRGVQPSGVTAASAISTLQESAQTRIRQKTRNLDFYLQGVGQKYASRVFQFYTVPEVYRLTGDDGASNYFKMHVEPYAEAYPDGHPQAGQPTGDTMYRVHYQPFTSDGQIDPDQGTAFETKGKFDVKVATGSSLPFAKDQLENKLLAFFDRGIIDSEEVLKRSDYPNYQAVLERVQQKQAAAQQQQGGGGPPPKGGGSPSAAA